MIQSQIEAQVTQVHASQDAPPALQTAAAPTEPPLVNLMEAFVEKRLDAALKKFKCCTCERCRKDVLAITLNKLPPLYVIEDDPDIRDLHERERAAQVATALVQAILAVKANPTHQTSR
ncbi:late competence development ComFB family protein [Oscillospiraceae bacterium LTW-04]